jgi:hypothetical protein
MHMYDMIPHGCMDGWARRARAVAPRRRGEHT